MKGEKAIPQYGRGMYPDHLDDVTDGYPDVQKRKPKGHRGKSPGEVQDCRMCLTQLRPMAMRQPRVIKKPPRKVLIATEPSNGSGPSWQVLKNGTLKTRTRRK